MAELAEFAGSLSDAPWRVEPRAGLEMPQALSFRAEDVYESQSGAIDFVVFAGILLGIGDIEIGADCLHVEWSKVAVIIAVAPVVVIAVAIEMDGIIIVGAES